MSSFPIRSRATLFTRSSRAPLFAVALLVTTASAHAQVPVAPPPPALTLRADPARIPLDFSTPRPTVSVDVDGKGARPWILDTGAGGSVIDSAAAMRLGLEVVGRARVGSPGGAPIEAIRLAPKSIRVGDAELTGMALVGVPLPPGLNADGVLSYRVFGSSVMMLDFPARTLSLTKTPLIAGPAGASRYELNRGLIQVPATIGARSLSLDVDTGNGSTFTLPRALMDSLSLAGPAVPGPDVRLISGSVRTWSAKLSGTIRIAGAEFTDPDVTFIDLDRGNIGMGFLRQFVVTIDQAQQLIRFVRATSTSTSTSTSTRTARVAVTKSVERNTCAAPPTLRDHEISILPTPGDSLVIDDGNGQWRASVTPSGAFRSERRTGELADGTRLDVRLAGTYAAGVFDGVLTGERFARAGTAPTCSYAVRWRGTLHAEQRPPAEVNQHERGHRLHALAHARVLDHADET